MNSQTKAVAIAGAAGLALGLLSQVSSVVSQGYVAPLDTSNPFNGGVLGYWSGALGIFPLVAILLTIAATARKAGWRRSILNGFGSVLGVWLVICIMVIVVAAATYPIKEHPFAEASAARTDFVSHTISSCLTRRQAVPENASSSAAVTAFCTCSANYLADVMTRDELQYFEQQHAPSPSAIAKISAAQKNCTETASVSGN
jgi:hypothetical protein